jgi:hypothetical protein
MKKTCAIAGIFAFACFMAFADDDAFVARYDFREGAGNILKDKSGNSLNCKILKGKWVKTEYGPALKFSGKERGAQTSSSNKLDIRKGNFTICVFLKIPEKSKRFRIVEKGAGAGSNGYRFYFRERLGMIMGPPKPARYAVVNGNGGFRNQPINDGKWHFVSCVCNRDKNMQIYVDGEPSGKPRDIEDIKGLPVGNKENFYIYMGIDEESSCVIADISIYRKALTKVQIKDKHAEVLQKKIK